MEAVDDRASDAVHPPATGARDDHVDRTALAVDALPPACGVLAGVFAALAPLHLMTLPGDAGLYVAGAAALTAVALATLGVGLGAPRTRGSLQTHAPRVGFAVAAFVLVNTLVHLAATSGPAPTANVVAAVIGVGALISVRWHVFVLVAVTDVAWLLIAAHHGFGTAWQQSAGALGAATALAAVLYTVRHRTVARLEQARSQLEAVAVTDHLTGLRNRRGLLLAGGPLLELSRRSQTLVTILYLDLDGLKRVNDQQGHAAGDALIVRAARVLAARSRASDVVARLGGDEFAVLLAGTGREDAECFVSRLRAGLDAEQVSASIGAVEVDPLDPQGLDLPSLLDRADARMYEVKRRRRLGQTVPG